MVGSYQGCSEALHGLAREAATATATAKWRQMGVRSVHEALGIYTHDVHRRWGCGVASSGGRGRASSAAACPSLGGRAPTSFTTARGPRTRTAERLLAGPRRGRRCTRRRARLRAAAGL